MATFKLSIDCDNAAFGETLDERCQEVARLLRVAADWLDEGGGSGGLRDVNGNRVGSFTFNGKMHR